MAFAPSESTRDFNRRSASQLCIFGFIFCFDFFLNSSSLLVAVSAALALALLATTSVAATATASATASSAPARVPYRVDPLCTFPVVSVTGTAGEVGRAVGEASAARLQGYLQSEPLFNTVVLPYYQTPAGMLALLHPLRNSSFSTHLLISSCFGKFSCASLCHSWSYECTNRLQILTPNHPTGKSIVSAWIANVQQQLPRVAAELEGLALGLGMPADMVYLLNMQDEVSQLANETAFAARQSKAHCMDYLINQAPASPAASTGASEAYAPSSGARFHAHNEDGDTSVPRFALWLNATYTDAAPGESASFFAFVYPGQLAGNAFGFTGALESPCFNH
jgi:hypothetical protein